jgi:hypothetical protein
MPHRRLTRTFRHGVPGFFKELKDALQQRAVPYVFGKAVQLVKRTPVEAVELVAHTRPSHSGGVYRTKDSARPWRASSTASSYPGRA